MNSYLLESIDSLSLKQERESIIQKNHFEDASKSYYDLEENLLENALEDLDTYSLLSEKKVIIIQNIEEIKYEDFKKNVDHLFQYIQNPNPDNLLIIEAKKLNNTTKITKELKKLCTYSLVSIDSKEYIKKTLKGYKIDSNTISFLEEYCLNDFTKIANECEKLKEYKWDEKEITKKDIEEIVVKKLGDSKDLSFALGRAIALRDKEEALKKYQELLSYNIEPLSMIGLLASQIRIIYQVKLLEDKHLNNKEIADTLEEKSEYRIMKTRELTKLYQEKDLLLLLQRLAEMDYLMKTEDVDGKHLIEMFIINM